MLKDFCFSVPLTAFVYCHLGKTNLLSAYWNSELPATYSMTVFDNYTAIVKVNDQQYLLDFWDSSGKLFESFVCLLIFMIDF
jgi:hypothetical protein